eukprot:Amastigsp_a347309_6.p4 type:complete len:100 gc:universal Amastigsp_a347309_6:537-836(+)
MRSSTAVETETQRGRLAAAASAARRRWILGRIPLTGDDRRCFGACPSKSTALRAQLLNRLQLGSRTRIFARPSREARARKELAGSCPRTQLGTSRRISK